MYVPLDYFTVLLFNEQGVLTHWVSQDDYAAWTDVLAGVTGSNLSDINEDGLVPADIEKQLQSYLEDMVNDYSVVYTNRPQQCEEWLATHNLSLYYSAAGFTPEQAEKYTPFLVTQEAYTRLEAERGML